MESVTICYDILFVHQYWLSTQPVSVTAAERRNYLLNVNFISNYYITAVCMFQLDRRFCINIINW